jgi:hypothetical protein
VNKDKESLVFVTKEQTTMIESLKNQISDLKKSNSAPTESTVTEQPDKLKSPTNNGSTKKKLEAKKDLSTPKKEALSDTTPVKLDTTHKKRKKDEEEAPSVESTPPPNTSNTSTSPIHSTPKSKAKKCKVKNYFIFLLFCYSCCFLLWI